VNSLAYCKLPLNAWETDKSTYSRLDCRQNHSIALPQDFVSQNSTSKYCPVTGTYMGGSLGESGLPSKGVGTGVWKASQFGDFLWGANGLKFCMNHNFFWLWCAPHWWGCQSFTQSAIMYELPYRERHNWNQDQIYWVNLRLFTYSLASLC
jgi:hypothetical protein